MLPKVCATLTTGGLFCSFFETKTLVEMLQLRKALPSLKQLGCARHLTQGTGALAGTPTPKEDADDADAYQLLPPGCSMIDPTYGLNE